jgi:hypothetical protein
MWDNGQCPQSKKIFGIDIVFNSKIFMLLVTYLTHFLQECSEICCYTSSINIFRGLLAHWFDWMHKRFFTRWKLDCASRLVSTLLGCISDILYLHVTTLLTLCLFFVLFISYLLPFTLLCVVHVFLACCKVLGSKELNTRIFLIRKNMFKKELAFQLSKHEKDISFLSPDWECRQKWLRFLAS